MTTHLSPTATDTALRQATALSTILLPILLIAVACGDNGPDSAQQLTGTWSFTDSLLNWSSFRSKTCTSGSGTLTITQSGNILTGSLTDETACIADTSGLGLREGSISNGTVTGNQVSFEVSFCRYGATTSGDPPTMMTGTETCVLHYGVTDSAMYDGDWHASR